MTLSIPEATSGEWGRPRMANSFWDASLGSAPVYVTGRAIRTICDQKRTGVLFMHAEHHTNLDLYVSEGRITGGRGETDDWMLARLVVSTGMVAPDLLEAYTDELQLSYLADVLVDHGLVSREMLGSLVNEMVLDSLMFACITPWESLRFAECVTAPPDPYRVDMDGSALLVQAAEWYGWVKPVMDLASRGPNLWIEVKPGVDLDGIEQRIVSSLIGDSVRFSELMAMAPLPRWRTLEVVVQLLSVGVVSLWTVVPERLETSA